MRETCPPFVVALEVIHRDRGFVFGESVSPIPVHNLCLLADRRVSFFNGGLLFSSITLSAIAVISLYSFLLLVKTKFAVSGSFGGMSLPTMISIAAFLTDFRPGRDALWAMDALCYSHVYHNLTARLCLRIYDLRRGELAELCLCCFALHVVHPSPISHRHATRHIPSHGAYPKFGEA